MLIHYAYYYIIITVHCEFLIFYFIVKTHEFISNVNSYNRVNSAVAIVKLNIHCIK